MKHGYTGQVLDFLFPKTLPKGPFLAKYQPVRLDTPQLRLQGLDAVHRVIAVAPYRNLHREIRALKYRQGTHLLGDLAELLVRASALLPMSDQVFLCPVPLHWSRRLLRGYNQSQLLAQELALRLSVPMFTELRRVRATLPQTRRSHDERRHAVQHAFHSLPCMNKHIILVDDVCTTGATLNACACALHDAGAKRIDGLVLAQSFDPSTSSGQAG